MPRWRRSAGTQAIEMSEENSSRGGSPLKAMVSFFTIWQQDITQEDMDAMERKFYLAPVAGLFFSVLIIIEMIVLILLSREVFFGSSAIMAIAVLATVYVGSRFIHFDGLTDFGDGMIVSGTQEDHVRALKDTLVGAGGLGVALIVTLASFSVYSYIGAYLIVLAAVAEVMVKNAMVVAAAYGKPGNGMAGRQVGLTDTGSAVHSTIISLVLGLVVGMIGLIAYNLLMGLNDAFFNIEIVLVCVVFGLVVSWAVGYLMARKSNEVFGMVNGDILGATNEIARLFVVFFMALAVSVFVW